MPNMLDYLAWRGDLPLSRDPLNENDELILSQFAYIAFGEHIHGLEAAQNAITIADAVSWLLEHDPNAELIHQTGYMWKDNLELIKVLNGADRFSGMRLSNYVDVISPEDEKQFAAITIALGDGSTMVAFRGTDDSLIGWKEDLNMALSSAVPAQKEAVRYLERVAASTDGPLRVCGHSKGGNLAVFASSLCHPSVQDRILSIVSHDGPGHSRQLIKSEGYSRIRDRLRVYIPHFSFVGILLEHDNNYTVVRSDAKNILQHDAFSWQMQGTRMICAETPAESSLHTNRIIREWMHSLNDEDQRLFVEAVYEVACATYGDTLPEDVEHSWPLSAQSVFTAMFKLEPKLRNNFTKSLGDLFATALKNFRFPWQHEEESTLAETVPELDK